MAKLLLLVDRKEYVLLLIENGFKSLVDGKVRVHRGHLGFLVVNLLG